ncbi:MULTISPECIES: 4Fe-4S dicluster domain-containing protein [Tepidanaerobacter]|uniref:4Fe-4S dicluster domain-containing protein n=1 Tax=Tepidanaerobacter sp. EBM-49 TaxID=1918504 RepID=UPI00073F0DC2|nr:4Fe-4S dicluster domain-containing protein [Tepidanaerobacter syntrophicus]HHV83598.1 4Fe-4S binding protein [Tepidanaerobacter syntrophicus]
MIILIEKHIKIIIDEKACKKCGLCIAFCPRKVYVSSEDGRPAVARLSACTNCKLCELRCPDYAIVVGGEDDE